MSQTKTLAHIYNPQTQSEEELMKNFVVRQREFNIIFDDIKNSDMKVPEQPYIIQGQRGQGKTTLLLKLYYEIKNNKNLKKFIVPVLSNEEQYQINSLLDLWLYIAEKIEDENDDFVGIYDEINDQYDSDDSERNAFKSLEKKLKEKKKKIILLLDNIGTLLDKLDIRDQRRIREVLITCAEIRVIGASAVVLESTFDYAKPFYEFFRVINLEGLSQEDTVKLLLNLGEFYKFEQIKKIVADEPGRVESLRRLTSGVPRTIILLFEIFVDNENGNAFRDLELVLDRVTPLYKHRMDDLSPQQQKIVNAVALNWDAIGVKELSEQTHMESKAVSSQLKQLEKNRIVHKIKTDNKNYFYQITERFFNIWYLMRYGKRKGKGRVQWLVSFLQCWCGEDDLRDRALRHIDAIKKGNLYPRHAYYLTEALARTLKSDDLQHELIVNTREYLKKEDKTLLKELSKSDLELFDEAWEYGEKGEFQKALNTYESIENKDGSVLFNMAVIFDLKLKDFKKAESYYLEGVKKGVLESMYNLAYLYKYEFKDFKKAEVYYLMAVKKGNSDAMFNLALLYKNEFKDFKKAEEYYLMAVEKGDADATNGLAYMYFKQKINKSKALELIREAVKSKIDASSNYVWSMIRLWNNEIEEALKIGKEFLEDQKFVEDYLTACSEYFILLMAKKQFYAALKLFEYNPFDLKDRMKPVYYALMYFLKDDYPNEYLKMGSELKETVDEIIAKVHQWEIDYA